MPMWHLSQKCDGSALACSVRRAAAAAAIPLHDLGSNGAGAGEGGTKGHARRGRPVSTPWRSILAHPAGKDGGVCARRIISTARHASARLQLGCRLPPCARMHTMPAVLATLTNRGALFLPLRLPLRSVGHRGEQLHLPLRLLRGHELVAHLL